MRLQIPFLSVCLFVFFTGMGVLCIKSSKHRLKIPFAIFFIFNRIIQKQVKKCQSVYKMEAAVYEREICNADIGRSKKK